jgi:outer membrane protein assembly factor BamB
MSAMPMLRLLVTVAVALTLSAASAPADEVVGWRTDGTGRYPDASPPVTWSDSDNVVWSCPLPSRGNATPVFVGGRLFVTAEPFKLICVNASDGKIAWQADNGLLDTVQGDEGDRLRAKLADADDRFRELRDLQNRRNRLERSLRRNPDNAETKQQADDLQTQIDAIETELAPIRDYRPPVTHDTNGYASPTPTSDGKRVFAHFGNGVAAAYDFDGTRLWIRMVQQPEHQWGHSSSPVLAGNTLVVLVRDLFGLDPDTGEVKWRTRSRHRWGSPIATQIGDTHVIITPNGEVVRADDGHTLATGLGQLEYAAPVVHDGVVYFIENNSRAVRLPQTAAEPFEVERLWSARVEGDRHYASPVIHDGLIYTISRGENLTVLDAATGDKLYERPMRLGGSMPNSAYPSITLAGNLLYVSSESGATAVMRPGREYDEVARNKTTGFRGSPVFVGDRLYLRCFDALRCISDARSVRAGGASPALQ